MAQELRSIVFSELIDQNVDVLSCFSPNGLNFAYAIQSQLIILDVESQKTVQVFLCDYPINYFEWSPASDLIYCCMKKQRTIQIWNLTNTVWRCKITEYPLAIAEAYWTPDSRHLLVISEFHLKLTVWSLISTTTALLNIPKPIKNCISFSYCKKYLAVAERRKHKDFISIYTCDTWEILKCFSLETKDSSGIYFSPSDLVIAVLEAFSEEAKVVFYSIDGRILGKYVRCSRFGFTNFSWNPDGKLMAVKEYFGVVTIIRAPEYEEIISYSETESINLGKTTIYKIKSIAQESPGNVSSNLELFEVVKDKSLVLSSFQKQSEKIKLKHIRHEIKSLSFSHCGKYLLSLNGSFPKTVFVFDLSTHVLSSVVIHHNTIKGVSWHPTRSLLAICCGSQNVNLWTPTCCISLRSPFRSEFSVISAEWCPSKSCLLLNAKSQSALLYFPDGSEERDDSKLQMGYL